MQAKSPTLPLQTLTYRIPRMLEYCLLAMLAVHPTRSQMRRPFPAFCQTEGPVLGQERQSAM